MENAIRDLSCLVISYGCVSVRARNAWRSIPKHNDIRTMLHHNHRIAPRLQLGECHIVDLLPIFRRVDALFG